MRYVPVLDAQGRSQDPKHPVDCQRLVDEGQAVWRVDANGIRYVQLVETP